MSLMEALTLIAAALLLVGALTWKRRLGRFAMSLGLAVLILMLLLHGAELLGELL
jgi:hypothetical protein